MEWHVEFYYKVPGSPAPDDTVGDDDYAFKDIPPVVPNIGDIVHYKSDGQAVARKVVGREFLFYPGTITACIITTDLTDQEQRSLIRF